MSVSIVSPMISTAEAWFLEISCTDLKPRKHFLIFYVEKVLNRRQRSSWTICLHCLLASMVQFFFLSFFKYRQTVMKDCEISYYLPIGSKVPRNMTWFLRLLNENPVLISDTLEFKHGLLNLSETLDRLNYKKLQILTSLNSGLQ